MACGDDSASTTPDRVVVISLNILHGIRDEDPDAPDFDRIEERLAIIGRALAAEEPDVVLLQEVFVAPLPGYPDVVRTLLDALGPGYTAFFGDISGAPLGEGGIGQLTITRLAVVSGQNQNVGGIRSLHRLTLQTPAGGFVAVYNAHLEGTSGEEQGLTEIERVLDFLDQSARDAPAVLGGDFNARPSDPAVRRLLERGFSDTLAAAGRDRCERAGDPGCTSSTIPLGDPGRRASRRIDYVFLRDGAAAALRLEDARPFLDAPATTARGPLWASDHIGMMVTISVLPRR
jgi:endonuclease/exonuclease/phosphatase family metal-dependent hydrolase